MAICGIVMNQGSRPVDGREISRMVSALALRDGWLREQSAASEAVFGATSLAGSGSFWESDQITVVCEGDIYNREELQAEFKARPGKAGLACLFGEIYLERGLKLLDCLRGVFSLAI